MSIAAIDAAGIAAAAAGGETGGTAAGAEGADAVGDAGGRTWPGGALGVGIGIGIVICAPADEAATRTGRQSKKGRITAYPARQAQPAP
jgi:hypothetical protein